MSSAVMLIILFPQKSWWSHVPTVHQRLIGLGDPVWRSLRVAEYHQDGTSLCPGKVEDVEGSNRLRQVSAKEKWKNRSPMLSNCPHVAYVASGFFHVLKWLLMDVWWLVMSDDFWWFLMISAWPASLTGRQVTWGRTMKILTSELEGLPSEERTGTRWGTTWFWAKVGVY